VGQRHGSHATHVVEVKTFSQTVSRSGKNLTVFTACLGKMMCVRVYVLMPRLVYYYRCQTYCRHTTGKEARCLGATCCSNTQRPRHVSMLSCKQSNVPASSSTHCQANSTMYKNFYAFRRSRVQARSNPGTGDRGGRCAAYV